MEVQQIKDIFDFVDSVLQNKSDAEHRRIQSTLDLAEGVAKVIMENKHLVPYHLNLIDELHINENGHSRILYKLLEYRDPEGRYNFLESLLKYIAKDCEKFGEISVTEPVITQELCRIDLWVRDKVGGYAIIFENKVYNATDQEAQLSRYIECTKTNGFTDEQIFVIYMPQKDDKDPVDDSWSEYKEDFASRYVKFSFRNGVLPWLKSDVLPSIPDKDPLLKSAIEQYVDYLEGLFKQRESDKILNTMVEDYIKEKLKLNGKAFDNYRKVRQYREDINTVLSHLNSLNEKIEHEMFKEWKNGLIQHFPNYKNISEVGKRGDRIYVGVNLEICGNPIKVVIERETNIYYGIYYENRDDNVESLIKHAIPSYGEWHLNKHWYCWKHTDLESALPNLIELIKAILPLTKQ